MKPIVLLCLLAACGSTEKQTSVDPGRRDNGEPVKDCAGNPVEMPALNAGYKYIDGNRLYVKNSDQRRVSLCDASKGNKAMVFQLAGITCLTCQDEAKYLSKFIRSSEVGHAIVFTDFFEDYSEVEFGDFMRDFAPGSKRYHDDKINLWKMFSKDPAHPVRPTVLVFGKAGVSYLYNTEGEEIHKTIREVVETLGAQVNPAPEPEPSPEPEPEVNDLTPDFEMKGLNGHLFNLRDAFTKEYAVLDFSQWNCIYCKRAADAHNKDQAYQETIKNGPCDAVTFIPTQDISSWASRYLGTFIGDRTFAATDKTQRQVASEYGYKLRATPSYLLVNRKGEILDSQTGGLPRRFSETCKHN